MSQFSSWISDHLGTACTVSNLRPVLEIKQSLVNNVILKAHVLVRSRKLSSDEPIQFWGGWLLWNSKYCKQSEASVPKLNNNLWDRRVTLNKSTTKTFILSGVRQKIRTIGRIPSKDWRKDEFVFHLIKGKGILMLYGWRPSVSNTRSITVAVIKSDHLHLIKNQREWRWGGGDWWWLSSILMTVHV